MKKEKISEWVDPVVEETRERGRSLTKRFNNDLKKITKELKKIQNLPAIKKRLVSEIKVVKKAS